MEATTLMLNGQDYHQLSDKEKTNEMLARVLTLIDDYKADNKFWVNFKNTALNMKNGKGPITDPQFLLHSNIYYLKDLFEECDQDGFVVLEEFERDCC